MSTERSVRDFYVTGGTVPPDAGSYVVRAADRQLLEALEHAEYCHVLTTRQMGKSSLMTRTAERLAEAGAQSIQITLETIVQSGDYPDSDKFFYGIANRIDRKLGFGMRLSSWWQERNRLPSTQRFYEYLTELLPGSHDRPLVVFIDEIDSMIGQPFADDFFATIRACYNERASNPALKRLTFVLLGVATPAQLVSGPTRTPFNIGTNIELTDFTADEAARLTEAFPAPEKDREIILKRVLYWTGGHPYLTQTLCQAIAERLRDARAGSRRNGHLTAFVDEETNRLFLRPEAARDERNLQFVRSRLTLGHSDLHTLLRMYQQVLRGRIVIDVPASSVHTSLKLAGVVRVDENKRLRPRNRIYEHVFGPKWVKGELPPRDWARVAAGIAARFPRRRVPAGLSVGFSAGLLVLATHVILSVLTGGE